MKMLVTRNYNSYFATHWRAYFEYGILQANLKLYTYPAGTVGGSCSYMSYSMVSQQ